MQLPGGLPIDYHNMTEEQKKTSPPDKLKSILRKIILIGRLAETVNIGSYYISSMSHTV